MTLLYYDPFFYSTTQGTILSLRIESFRSFAT